MKKILLSTLLCGLLLSPSSVLARAEEDPEKEKEKKPPIITEAVTVTARIPRELPFATTSAALPELVLTTAARDLTDILPYVPGTYVSSGNKNEWGIQIRGIGSSRITLLYDGIPMYEPYYNSFDLRSISADLVESVTVVKGASSILYGANNLGGVVDIATRRPKKNNLALLATYGANKSYNLQGSGSISGRRFSLSAAASYETSDGFDYLEEGERLLRENSDSWRSNLVAKFFYYPAERVELMAEAGYYKAEYGITPATVFNRPRYWRFSDWERVMANVGASMPLAKEGYFKLRGYYVSHFNVLDAYRNNTFTTLQWVSTYDNYAIGAFALGMIPLGRQHQLHFSLNARDDRVKQQGDLGVEWENYYQQVYSVGVEDHFQLNQQVGLLLGASLDYLSKQDGVNKTSLNPILGIKYTPADHFKLHLTTSQKSRFPTMRNLYSSTGGNPDLRDERGTNVEAGFTYDLGLMLSGTVFHNKIRDLIDRRMLGDGTFLNINVASARLMGFEIEGRKAFGSFLFSLNYTYLHTRNLETDERLAGVPNSQVGATLRFHDPRLFSLTIWGQHAGNAVFDDGRSTYTVPAYTVAHAIIERAFPLVSLFIKIENLFNAEYMPEPGFPMRARTLLLGLRLRLEGK